MTEAAFDFGIVGVGVMGSNLLWNMADHGYKVIGFDKNPEKTAFLEKEARSTSIVKGVNESESFIKMLARPRKIMMLVPAGKPVDEVISELVPLMDEGDILIDGGNSHFKDTNARIKLLQPKGIHFMGVGISGGEEGARLGPSIMPGGDAKAYAFVEPILASVAAIADGEACVAYLGKDAAGHYVKMVHNGIEYAIMQMISECYQLLHVGLELDNNALAGIFSEWDKGDLQSFLIEITAQIFLQHDDETGNRLIDMILDKAGAKGTGKWTSQDALDLPAPIPSIEMAVFMRNISSLKDQRISAAKLYDTGKQVIDADKKQFIDDVHDALYFGMAMGYVQGLAMLQTASSVLEMEIPMPQVVRVWKGGCIIRSAMLPAFYKAYSKNAQLENLLLDSEIAEMIKGKLQGVRNVVIAAVSNNIPVAGLMASLAYFDAYTSERLPINLVQAQRDFFGAHTYERTDKPGMIHTDWNTKK